MTFKHFLIACFPDLYLLKYKKANEAKIERMNKYASYSDDEKKDFIIKKYERKIGRIPNIENPVTYTEKIQWSKFYDSTPIKTRLADKYLAKEWAAEKIGKEYVVPIFGVWDSFDEINYDMLPDRFVLKTNHGSGNTVVVKNKKKFLHSSQYRSAKTHFDLWMRMNYAYDDGFEMHYRDIPVKIFAEEYLEEDGGLHDYRFMCFNGEVKYCYTDVHREQGGYFRNVYDADWNLQSWQVAVHENFKGGVPKPKNYEKMVEIAKVLSEGFAHVRVDLYNMNGKIYLGEMTFTNSSGFVTFNPDKYDEILGDMWILPEKYYLK